MNRTSALVFIAACFVLPNLAHATVIFEWATIRNAGNAPAPQTGRGAVDHKYRIGTTASTSSCYAARMRESKKPRS